MPRAFLEFSGNNPLYSRIHDSNRGVIRMAKKAALLAVLGLLLVFALPVMAAQGTAVPERVLGKERAPVVMEEFVSLTCPHCADFFLHTMPELEKRYVETGKMRIILRDYPLDGVSLKAAALARCMPADEYYPFIRILYENQRAWATASNPDKTLIQYARLGGLDEERAKFCLNDPAMQGAIVASLNEAQQKYDVKSTPTFVFNNGTEKMEGAGKLENFTAVLDRLLAHSR